MASPNLSNDPRLRSRLCYKIPELEYELRGRDRDAVIRFCVDKVIKHQKRGDWLKAEQLLLELNEGLKAEVAKSTPS